MNLLKEFSVILPEKVLEFLSCVNVKKRLVFIVFVILAFFFLIVFAIKIA